MELQIGMNWQQFVQPIARKLKESLTKVDNLQNEYDLMAFLWADEGAKTLLSLWLKKSYLERECKSAEKAKAFKAKGNKEFLETHYAESIDLYTKSALYAPVDSLELSVAIANRSAALFQLNRHNDCIQDIELAIKLNYPKKLYHKLYLRLAHCYLKLGKQKLANDVLLKLRELMNNSKDITLSMKDDIEKRISEMALVKSDKEICTEYNSLSTKYMPTVAFGANPEISYASAGINTKYSENKGKHIITNRFIKRGDVLFVEKALSFVFGTDKESKHLCHYCCCACPDIFIPCTMCLKTKYCSIKCSSEAWLSYHRWECPGSQIGLWENIGIGWLALKVLLTCTTMTDTIRFNEMQRLETNFDKRLTDDLVIYGITAAMLTIYLLEYTDYFKANNFKECLFNKFSDKTLTFNTNVLTHSNQEVYVGSFILRHILQLISNGHGIPWSNEKSMNESRISGRIGITDIIAVGIFPSASLMNHSCDPNIQNEFRDQHLTVRAIRDIPKGHEVFNCYGPHYRHMSREKRQEILQKHYHFTCDCDYCTLPELQYFEEKFTAMKCPKCSDALYNINSSLYCIKCRAARIINNEMKLQLAEEMYASAQDCIASKNMKEAINKLEECLRIRRDMLYKYHDDIAATLDLLAEAYFIMDRWLDSISYREEKLVIVIAKFGPVSVEEIKEVNQILNCCVKYLTHEQNRGTKNFKKILKKMDDYAVVGGLNELPFEYVE